MSLTQIKGVLEEVAGERMRQHEKWGEQDHPDHTGEPLRFPRSDDGRTWSDRLRSWAILRCDQSFRRGVGGWEHILTEEWAEALAETDQARLRAELIQVAAVACAWVEAIDRRNA